MPTNNFLQWNSGQANQESDSAYAADSTRAGGAPVNGIFPSALANKLFYQLSTLAKAIADWMNGEGQNAQDGNEAALSAAFGAAIGAQIATAQQPSIVTVPFSSNPTFDIGLGKGEVIFYIILTGNVTSGVIANTGGLPFAGKRVRFMIQQDGAGGHTFVWPNIGSSIPGDVIDPGAGNMSIQSFIADPNLIFHPLSPLMVG